MTQIISRRQGWTGFRPIFLTLMVVLAAGMVFAAYLSVAVAATTDVQEAQSEGQRPGPDETYDVQARDISLSSRQVIVFQRKGILTQEVVTRSGAIIRTLPDLMVSERTFDIVDTSSIVAADKIEGSKAFKVKLAVDRDNEKAGSTIITVTVYESAPLMVTSSMPGSLIHSLFRNPGFSPLVSEGNASSSESSARLSTEVALATTSSASANESVAAGNTNSSTSTNANTSASGGTESSAQSGAGTSSSTSVSGNSGSSAQADASPNLTTQPGAIAPESEESRSSTPAAVSQSSAPSTSSSSAPVQNVNSEAISDEDGVATGQSQGESDGEPVGLLARINSHGAEGWAALSIEAVTLFGVVPVFVGSISRDLNVLKWRKERLSQARAGRCDVLS